jgi:hypothetical protein
MFERLILSTVFAVTLGSVSMAQEQPPLNQAEWQSATELLVRAKELIEIGPWGKPLTDTSLAGPDEITCIAFAMNDAQNELGTSIVNFEYARLAMSQAIDAPDMSSLSSANDPLSVPYWGRYFMYWNDAESRTKEEVLDAMDRAIEIAAGSAESSNEKLLSGDDLMAFDLENMRRLGFME